MEQLDIFGGEICEYLFVIDPDQKTYEKVIELRMLLNNTISLSEEVFHSKPHISLCYFEATNSSDEYILTKAIQVLSSVNSFDVQLKGSEIWKNGTFVLKVNPDENILELQKQLSSAFKGVIKNFHLTIARNISIELSNELPTERFDYQSQFNCNSIYILKKKENKPYHIFGTIHLEESTS